MPLFMDVHKLGDAVGIDDVAKAHMADLQEQDKYDVKYLRYWVDESAGTIFCLAEAPSAEAAATGSTSTSVSASGSPWSDRRVRASRRSDACWPASTRRARAR